MHERPAAPQDAQDFTEEAERAHQALMENQQAMDRLIKREIAPSVIEKYKIGYDPAGLDGFCAAHPEIKPMGRAAGEYRLIFPFLDGEGRARYFIGEIWNRREELEKDKRPAKYAFPKGLKKPIWNEHYLTSTNPPPVIFITEGIYDALSIESAGGHAVALMGTGTKRMAALIKNHHPAAALVICPDQDTPGQEAGRRLEKDLHNAGAESVAIRFDAAVKRPDGTPCKDCNEEATADPAAFTESIKHMERELLNQGQSEEDAYDLQSGTNALARLWVEAGYRRTHPALPTGLHDLDEALDGGLFPGLYVIGAPSSLGKTTFCLQIADHIASQGQDVLIFSLEMGAAELAAKSISRLAFIEEGIKAPTTRRILSGAWMDPLDPIVESAMEKYRTFCDRLHIIEGTGKTGIPTIRKWAETHRRLKGAAPVIVVDYLQIIYPEDPRMDTRTQVETALTELRVISRDLGTPVMAISSINRAAYGKAMSMESFKESGKIEFSADVLIGLQYTGAENAREQDIEERREMAAKGEPIAVDAVILKNRNGRQAKVELATIPKWNAFTNGSRAAWEI